MYAQFWKDNLANTKQLNGHIVANCPFCGEEKMHFHGNIQTGLWDCKKCQNSGNALTFLREYKQMKTVQAFQCLEQYGITSNQQFQEPIKRQIKAFDKAIIETCCKRLTEQKLSEFASERGLSVDVLRKYQLGINDINEYTLPVVDELGRIRNILRREMGESTISSTGGEGLLFGIDDLMSDNKEVFVVEGAWSALALKERGYKAVGTCGAGVLKDEQVHLFKDKEVYIVPDNDEPGKVGAERIIKKLKPVAKNIYVINLPLPDKKDVRDYFKDGGTKEEFEKILGACSKAGAPNANNLSLLFESKINHQEEIACNSIFVTIETDSISADARAMCMKVGLAASPTGIPYPNIDNVQRVLSFYRYALRFDEFSQRVFKPNCREWDDSNTLELTLILQRVFGCNKISPNIIDQGIAAWAYQNRYNEPKDYFNTLTWDGVSRIDTFFSDYIGCKLDDYSQAVSRNFWLSLVARIYRPGIQSDCMVILEGEQGVKKSTLLKTVAGKWYDIVTGNLDDKDFYLKMQGCLIFEFAELQAFDRNDIKKLKAVISSSVDRFRVPFGKRTQAFPRQITFTGTTNEHVYLLDDTGGRRYWPLRVLVNMIEINKLKDNRDQLFAEAVYIFNSENVADDSERIVSSWWNVPESAKDEQEARRQAHPWQEIIEDFIDGKSIVTTNEIIDKCLDIPRKERNKSQSMTVGKILTLLKWEHKQPYIDGRKKWAYVNPNIKAQIPPEGYS